MRRIDLTNRRFGRLTAQWPAGIQRKRIVWLCLCDCGNLTFVQALHLPNGHTRSCGCRRIETIVRQSLTHGQAAKRPGQTTEYNSYCQAKARCQNQRNPAYKYYGGRGIEFRFTSFEEFFAEIGPRPKGYELDRENNEGHYEKGNVRWVTLLESRRNRRFHGRLPFQPLQ